MLGSAIRPIDTHSVASRLGLGDVHLRRVAKKIRQALLANAGVREALHGLGSHAAEGAEGHVLIDITRESASARDPGRKVSPIEPLIASPSVQGVEAKRACPRGRCQQPDATRRSRGGLGGPSGT